MGTTHPFFEVSAKLSQFPFEWANLINIFFVVNRDKLERFSLKTIFIDYDVW